MKAAILSAGLNRRLSILQKPKGLLEIGGKTLFWRTLSALERLGFTEVFCVVRKDALLIEEYLEQIESRFTLTIIRNDSRTPFDSLMVLGDYLSGNEGVLTFNCDAVYDYEDLRAFVENLRDCRYIADKDMIMLASPYVEEVNDNPAFISIGPDDRVVDYGKDIAPSEYVFGQIRYCSARILHMWPALRGRQIERIKSFINYLIQNRYFVYAHRANNPVYDIDTPADVERVKRIVANAKSSLSL